MLVFSHSPSVMILYNSIICTILTIKEVPPALIKGSVRPVFGSILIFTPILTNAWITIRERSQTAKIFIYVSLMRWRSLRTIYAKKLYSASMNILPTKPISSENAAKMKSLWASGRYQNFCNPLPYHCPANHHHQIAIRACWFCRHALRSLSVG